MAPCITFQPITVATDSDDRYGMLLLADGELVAVLVRLADDTHGASIRGHWYMEAGFGLAESHRGSLFLSLDEASQSITDRLRSTR